MKRTLVVILLILNGFQPVHAQGFRERYEHFKQQSTLEYMTFRRACNNRYIEFLRQSWLLCEAQEVEELPHEEWIPPIVMEEEGHNRQGGKRMEIDSIVVVQEDSFIPQPLVPIDSIQTSGKIVCFDYFNTTMRIPIADNGRFRLFSINENEIAEIWEELSGPKYDETIVGCLQLREKHQLCDWAYLLMLYAFSIEYLGGENEAILLTAYLLSQSGYQMRLGMTDNELFLLIATEYIVYGRPYFCLDGLNYLVLNGGSQSMKIVANDYPVGQPLSLAMNEEPLLSWRASEPRLLTGSYSLMAASAQINLNLLEFMDLYPNAQWGENPMTRWAMYANTPLDPIVKHLLYPSLERAMIGKSLPEAANLLLDFVQTAFEYQYDEKVWGGDRAFFAEETLYYPYADCEDRSILYSRLVRDLLGLDVVLVYYPGHLATAVRFPMQLPGDFFELESGKYLVCDPTYIGAPIGVSMPNMDEQKAKVILLQ